MVCCGIKPEHSTAADLLKLKGEEIAFYISICSSQRRAVCSLGSRIKAANMDVKVRVRVTVGYQSYCLLLKKIVNSDQYHNITSNTLLCVFKYFVDFKS